MGGHPGRSCRPQSLHFFHCLPVHAMWFWHMGDGGQGAPPFSGHFSLQRRQPCGIPRLLRYSAERYSVLRVTAGYLLRFQVQSPSEMVATSPSEMMATSQPSSHQAISHQPASHPGGLLQSPRGMHSSHPIHFPFLSGNARTTARTTFFNSPVISYFFFRNFVCPFFPEKW